MKFTKFLYDRLRIARGCGYIDHIEFFGKIQCKRVRDAVANASDVMNRVYPEWCQLVKDYPYFVAHSWSRRTQYNEYQRFVFVTRNQHQYDFALSVEHRSLFVLRLVYP